MGVCMGLFHLLAVNDITLCLPAPVWLLYLLNLPTTCLLLLPQGAYCAHCACPMHLLYQLYAYLASALLCQLYSAYYFQCAYCAHGAQCAYYADHAVMYGDGAGMVESRLVGTCCICGTHL